MEKGIKARKKRNRILACCVPVCLCLVVLSVWKPYLSAAPGAMPGGPAPCLPESVPATGTQDLSVEITGDRAHGSVEEKDPAKVRELYCLLNDAFAEKPEKDEAVSGSKDLYMGGVSGKTQLQDPVQTVCYTFVFSGTDGEEDIFTLNGNVLSGERSDRKIMLSDGDRQALMTAIRAIIEWEVESE